MLKLICLFVFECCLMTAVLPLSAYGAIHKRALTEPEFPHVLLETLKIRHGIYYLEDLAKLSESQVIRLDGIGSAYLKHIKDILAKYELSFSFRESDLPVLDRSPANLHFPSRVHNFFVSYKINKVGQLALLDEADLKRCYLAPFIAIITDQLATLNMKLDTPNTSYDVILEAAFSRKTAQKFREYGLTTLREISVLTLEECLTIASQSAKTRTIYPEILEVLRRKLVTLGEFPFVDLSIEDRLQLYRLGFHTMDSTHRFLSDFGELSLKERLMLYRFGINAQEDAIQRFTPGSLAGLTGRPDRHSYWQQKLCSRTFGE